MADVYDTSGFTGSETIYRHPLSGYVYTEGVRHVAKTAGAYWLLDLIASYRHDPKVRKQEFQAWTLTTGDDHKATVVATDGNERQIARQEIDMTDFPPGKMVIWVEGTTMLLPSEH